MAAVSPRSGTEQQPVTHEDPNAVGQHAAGHGGTDPIEEPSVEWGWHGTFPRATRIAGWITAASLFLMVIGNHESNVENWWLVALGAGTVALLVAGRANRRDSWRRR